MSQDEGGFNGPSSFLKSCWLLLFVWHKELSVQQSCKDQVSLSSPLHPLHLGDGQSPSCHGNGEIWIAAGGGA